MRVGLTGVVAVAVALVGVSARGATARDTPATPLPLLTRIVDIRALSQDGGERGYPVRIRGTVTHFDEVLKATLFVHDGAFGQFVANPSNPAAVAVWAELKPGDLVEIEGRTVRGGFAPNVEPSRVRRLGRGAMPVGHAEYDGQEPRGCARDDAARLAPDTRHRAMLAQRIRTSRFH